VKRGPNTNAPCALCKIPGDEETSAKLAKIEAEKRARRGQRPSIVLCPQHLIAWRAYFRGRR
jgi:hypothetical protein